MDIYINIYIESIYIDIGLKVPKVVFIIPKFLILRTNIESL